jgi:hypothetical protein
MNDETSTWHVQIAERLASLNANLVRQMSLWHAFRTGIMYGFGFVVGSTLLSAFLATVALTFFSDTVFGQVVSWIGRTVH